MGSTITSGYLCPGSLVANNPESWAMQLMCILGPPPRTHVLGGVVFSEPGCGHVSSVLVMSPRVDVYRLICAKVWRGLLEGMFV